MSSARDQAVVREHMNHYNQKGASVLCPAELRKVLNEPALEQLLVAIIPHDLPRIKELAGVLINALEMEEKSQMEKKKSEEFQAIVNPAGGRVTKKRSSDQDVNTGYPSKKMQPKTPLSAVTAIAKPGSTDEIPRLVGDSTAQGSSEKALRVADRMKQSETDGAASENQEQAGAQAERNGAASEMDSSSEGRPTTDRPVTVGAEAPAIYTERDIIWGLPQAIEQVRAACHAHQERDTRRNASRLPLRPRVEQVCSDWAKLDPRIVRDRVLEFAEAKLRHPGMKARDAAAFSSSDPLVIYDVLEQTLSQTKDAKLHRAYHQIRLYETVRQMLARGRYGDGLAPHVRVLEELADRRAEDATEKVRLVTRGKFRASYAAGKKWLMMDKAFGGAGVVFVFIMAGELIATVYSTFDVVL